MAKFIALMQLFGAALLALASVATLVNLVLISLRQTDSIGVANTLIGQGILIIFMSALATILYRKGKAGLSSSQAESSSEAS